MKKMFNIMLAVLFIVPVATAFAASDEFKALNTLPAGERLALIPMTDDQLATIEGGKANAPGGVKPKPRNPEDNYSIGAYQVKGCGAKGCSTTTYGFSIEQGQIFQWPPFTTTTPLPPKPK